MLRREVAASRDLPDHAGRQLDEDPDVSVRRAAAHRPDTPPQVLLRLIRAHGDIPHIRPMLVVELLLTDPERRVADDAEVQPPAAKSSGGARPGQGRPLTSPGNAALRVSVSQCGASADVSPR
ncbi:hypothetical protein [Streptomyces sp. NPDC051109]|uniref:hypothetical protein n=1 Tax=Streptomyces sp. NPDC051109 TaxID=3365642 RepID=UPI0037911D34